MGKENTKTFLRKIFQKSFGKDKNERFNAIAMLIIFGLFIAIFSITVRNVDIPEEEKKLDNTSNPIINSTMSPTNPGNLEENIEDGTYEVNYSYLYTFNLNGKEEIITGKRLDSKEIFTIINTDGSTEYAKVSENYLKKEKDKYQLVDSPSPHLTYTNLDSLLEILDELTPNINQNQYTYYVPTNTILRSYYPNSTQFDSMDTYNTVVITKNENILEKIDIDYSSLYSLLNGTTTSYTITMVFNNIGTTEDFTIRIG